MYENLTFAQDSHGILWAYGADNLDPDAEVNPALSRPILAPGSEFHNLFSASLLLYKVNADSLRVIELLIGICEDRHQDDLVNGLQTIASNMQLTLRAAEEGLRSILSK